MHIAYNKRNGGQDFIRLDYEDVHIQVLAHACSGDPGHIVYDGTSIEDAHKAFSDVRRHSHSVKIILEVR